MITLLVGLTLCLAAEGGANFLMEWQSIRTWKQFVARYWAGWCVFITAALAITFIIVSFLGVIKID